MSTPNNLRAANRVTVANQVQMAPVGMMGFYVSTINIGVGGVLVEAIPSIPVGSSCKLAFLLSGREGWPRVMAEGTVIRSDTSGTAILFSRMLKEKAINILIGSIDNVYWGSVVELYMSYFRNWKYEDNYICENMLGINKHTYRNVSITTFLLCLALAILPVILLENSISLISNWLKTVISFVYGFLWFGFIQPFLDLFIFLIIRNRGNG